MANRYQINLYDSRHIDQPCQGMLRRNNLVDSIQAAIEWVDYSGKHSAIVRNGIVIARYWRDGAGLQRSE